MNRWPWSVLGIAATDDKSAIRKAYAAKLKQLDIDQEINAFADLRRARDHALSNVGTNATLDTDTEPSQDAEDDPYLSDDNTVPADFDPFGSDGTDGMDGFSFELSRGSASPFSVIANPLADSPVEASYGKLETLLFPNGEPSEEAMEWDDFETAQAELTKLLDFAGTTDIEVEQSIDYWLAEILADGWPRSAPLVEQASETFGWMSEAGQLSERPALVWLNARLRGMQYHAAITAPEHPLNGAWTYLSEPGRYQWWHFTKVRKSKARSVITHVRDHHPELEAHLESHKVAALEGSPAGFGPGVIRLLAVLFLLTLPLRFCDSLTEPIDAPTQTIEAAFKGSDAAQQQAEKTVDELFGVDADFAQIDDNTPVIARSIRVSALSAANFELDTSGPLPTPEELTRSLVLRAVAKAEFEDVLAINQLKLNLLREARKLDDDACGKLLLGQSIDQSVSLSPEQRDSERALSWTLAQKRLLDVEAVKGGPAEATVPGWVVGEILDSTGYSREKVNQALGDPAANGACNVQIALLQSVLRQPGRVPVELLRLP